MEVAGSDVATEIADIVRLHDDLKVTYFIG
jgi:cation transport ATPase